MENLGVRAALDRAKTKSTEARPSACLTVACTACFNRAVSNQLHAFITACSLQERVAESLVQHLLSKRHHIAFLSCFDLLAVSCKEVLSASGPLVVEREKSLESWRHAISEEDVVDREKDHDIVWKECKSRPRSRTPPSRASVQECTRHTSAPERDDGAAMEPVPNVSVHNGNCQTFTENKCRRCIP